MKKKNKVLQDIFQEKAVSTKQSLERGNDLWYERKRETVGATVVAIEEDAGTRNLTIMLDEGVDIDYQPGGGMGLPGEINDAVLDKVVNNLLLDDDGADFARQLLQPSDPYPGALLTAPDKQLLKLIAKKASDEQIDNLLYLLEILQDEAQTKKLQATYDVADMLELFPGIITPKELLEAQGPSHGNKTYCLVDYGQMQDDVGKDRQYIVISVLPEAGLHVQNMFGEDKEDVLHLGETSNHLYNLKVGDTLRVNDAPKNKTDFLLPDDAANTMVFIGQGNGSVPFVAMLKELQERKQAGEDVGPVRLVLAAKDEPAIWGLKFFKPYLEDGTIAQLDIALSRGGADEEKTIDIAPEAILKGELSDVARGRIAIHRGTRLADDRKSFTGVHEGLFSPDIASDVFAALETGGGVYVSSGVLFKNTMEKAVAEIAQRNGKDLDDCKGDLHVSKSPSRIQGETKGWSRRIAGGGLTNLLKKKP